MKLGNFLRFDPDYSGKGLKAGGKLEEKIWNEFSSNKDKLKKAVQAIISKAKPSETEADSPSEDIAERTEDLEALLDEFLKRWDYDTVKKLTLADYVGLGNKDTFCQWVETKTKILGSIKGSPSIKFGIY